MINTIVRGDCLEVLKGMPACSVNMQMTSPPYWGLRDYGVDGQLGLEKTPEEFLAKLWAIFDEVCRVLRDDGVCFVNLGDTYATQGICGGSSPVGDREYRQTDKQKQELMGKRNYGGISTKSLCMIPERFAIGMIDRGWILRNKIIWHKPNPMPSSVKDRFSNTHEFLYFFSKSKKYWFDLDAVRDEYKPLNRWGGPIRKANDKEKKNYGRLEIETKDRPVQSNALGKNPGDCWTIATQSFKESHFAVYPEKLCIKPIKAGCPKEVCPKCGKARVRIVETDYQKADGGTMSGFRDTERLDGRKGNPALNAIHTTIGWTDCGCGVPFVPGVVLDIFSGAGTSLLVAKKLGRDYIGIELKEEYAEMAERRIAKVQYNEELSL